MNRAATAQRGPASEAGAREADLVAQVPKKWRVWLPIKSMGFAIDYQRDHASLRHLKAPLIAPFNDRPMLSIVEQLAQESSKTLILSN